MFFELNSSQIRQGFAAFSCGNSKILEKHVAMEFEDLGRIQNKI